MQELNRGGRIKPLLRIFNEWKSSTGMGSSNNNNKNNNSDNNNNYNNNNNNNDARSGVGVLDAVKFFFFASSVR